MGSIFKKPKVDNSAAELLRKQEERLAEQEAQAKKDRAAEREKQKARQRAGRAGSRARMFFNPGGEKGTLG